MAGLIDKDTEIARLGKEIDRRRSEVERTEAKLANPSFVERAPADIVEKERQRLAELRSAHAQLEEQLAQIRAL